MKTSLGRSKLAAGLGACLAAALLVAAPGSASADDDDGYYGKRWHDRGYGWRHAHGWNHWHGPRPRVYVRSYVPVYVYEPPVYVYERVYEPVRVYEPAYQPTYVAPVPAPSYPYRGYYGGNTAAGLVGAAAGGFLGSQFGHGDGQLAATAAGTVAGFLLGQRIVPAP